MTLLSRLTAKGTLMQVAHGVHGVQFISWVFTGNIHNFGITLSLGTIDVYDDAALVESFMEKMQTEFVNRKFWTVIIGLNMAIIIYFEIFQCHRRVPLSTSHLIKRMRYKQANPNANILSPAGKRESHH